MKSILEINIGHQEVMLRLDQRHKWSILDRIESITMIYQPLGKCNWFFDALIFELLYVNALGNGIISKQSREVANSRHDSIHERLV